MKAEEVGMTAQIIDGRAIAKDLEIELKRQIDYLQNKKINLGLAIIIIGNDPASEIYVANKIKKMHSLGIHLFEYKLPENASQKMVLAKIDNLNNDPKVQGILVQLPL